jgi:uncharacterized membrane protein (DUF106 family)
MWHVNAFLTSLFSLMLTPFRSFHPLVSLFVVSLVTGILMLVVFRYTSDQEKIKEAKDKMKAHLLEIRLFKDDMGILFSAQKNILLHNFKYMQYTLMPMLVMIVPITLMLIHLNGWYGYRPLKPGESAIVSVKLSDQNTERLSRMEIEADKGLTVETPLLRIPETREVDWRVRADALGSHKVTVDVPGFSFQKSITVSDKGLVRVSPRSVSSGLWKVLLNPGERPLKKNPVVGEIDVSYPSRSYNLLGFEMDWIVVFFILSILSGFAFKGFLGVHV